MPGPYPPQRVFFAINSIIMPTPSAFTWTFPKVLGYTGAGTARYEPYWELNLTWDFLTWDEYSTLLTTYQGAQSGTIQILAPLIYGDPNPSVGSVTGARYSNYGNVLLDAPIPKEYVDNTYYKGVTMKVRRIQAVRNGQIVGIIFAPPLN